MDTLFWIAQVIWLAFVIAGAYEAFTYRELADPERARTVIPDNRAPSPAQSGAFGAEFPIA